ncbi:MAG: hypothetical protein JO352_06015 [Chloroflexi bacterium]|nr:hypothetical protein [Chloroflexota bacterium]MBV9599319.1 hypothetical protein [Chloroflexota bacterium]
MSRSAEYPGAGEGQVVSPAPRLSRTPMRAPRPASPIGADGEDIVRELGLGHRLDELVASGAVRMPQRSAVSL